MTPILPRWDLTSIYPALDSEAFRDAFTSLGDALRDLEAVFEAHGVGAPSAGKRRQVDDATVSAFEEATERLNALLDRSWTVQAYVRACVAGDSQNTAAQAKHSELQERAAAQQQLWRRYEAWIASLDLDALLARSAVAREHAHVLRRTAAAARHRMGDAEEDLAARLSTSGGVAWARLYRDVTARLTVTVRVPDGTTREMPGSATSALFLGADGELRRAARVAWLEAWERVAVPVAAALNGAKGGVRTLNTRRGWPNSLEPSLFANSTDRATLAAVHLAAREAFPHFHRFLRAKARLLGMERLAGWDLWAPVAPGDRAGGRHWGFHEAAEFILTHFAAYSQDLADLAARAFRERWVDAEPRVGKDPGGFSMPVRGGESRILLSYVPSFHSARVLAHELGHAYHNLLLWRRPALLRATPLPLGETASTFCEALVTDAALAQASGSARLAMLNDDLQWACQRTLGMYSQFVVEQRVDEVRAKRELSVGELKALSVETDREVYGDAIDPATHNPFAWAATEQYFNPNPGWAYYNWPYTFGLLFSLGLYARYREDPERFRPGFDDLLTATGTDDVAPLALRFGTDVRSADFWRAGFGVYRQRIRDFEELARQ